MFAMKMMWVFLFVFLLYSGTVRANPLTVAAATQTFKS